MRRQGQSYRPETETVVFTTGSQMINANFILPLSQPFRTALHTFFYTWLDKTLYKLLLFYYTLTLKDTTCQEVKRPPTTTFSVLVFMTAAAQNFRLGQVARHTLIV